MRKCGRRGEKVEVMGGVGGGSEIWGRGEKVGDVEKCGEGGGNLGGCGKVWGCRGRFWGKWGRR